MPEPRTERSFGVTGKLSSRQRVLLAEVLNHEGWPVLLDVMEMTVIEMESHLINTPVQDTAAVLAEHQKVQAGWQIYVQLQVKVHDEVAAYIRDTEPRPGPRASEEDLEILSIVEPFNEYEGEGETSPA